MTIQKPTLKLFLILAFCIGLTTVSCDLNPAPGSNQATPTPTSVVSELPITPTTSTSLCADFIGELEVRVMVGPAEAVGLEPFSIGYIPFYAVTDEAPYAVEGSGPLEYDDILVEEWGSYEVDLLLDTTITGECLDAGDDGKLSLEVLLVGIQTVEVIADNFHGEYPWEGSIPITFSIPLEEGASIEGEGWAFVLHLLGE